MRIIEKFAQEKVEAAFPEASMFPAMKVWSLPKNKRHLLEEYCNSGDYLAALKIDGYFYYINKTDNHTYFFSRSAGVSGMLTEKSSHIPHIIAELDKLPPNTILIGEVYVSNGTSKDVTKIMGCLPEKAIQRQEAGEKLRYYVHDIILLGGNDLRDVPFEDRLTTLNETYNEYLSESDYIDLAVYIDTDIYNTARALIAMGEEGMVLKKKTALYLPDKRPAWSSIKIKPEETFDVVIMGFNDPEREYKGTEGASWQYWEETEVPGRAAPLRSAVTKAWFYGWKGAIRIGAYDEEGNLLEIGTISSGLTDEMKKDFAENPDVYIGTAMEVKCMSVDSKERTLRHGYFVRFRDDKDAESCLVTDIFT